MSDTASAKRAAPLLYAQDIEKTYSQGGESLSVLKNLNLAVESGEMVALVGPSGAGKSTLLHIIGLLDKQTSGRILVSGQDATGMNDEERTRLRRETIGFIYQFHFLQPEFSALENVILPQMIAGVSKKQAAARGRELLESLGLGHRLSHRPARLSGGEQQRVAIARALANRPKLLLADEPTGNLDQHASADVFDLLLQQIRGAGIGALIATHNMDLAYQMDRILELKNGRLVLGD
jgi:lipoprotein-releasing system ATP-binding protein